MLERALADAERLVQRRDRVVRHLAILDEELREDAAGLVESLTIPTPCKARWEDMRGDDTVRRCARCDREVHDLTRMTKDEIALLFSSAAKTPGARMRRRPDGRVVGGECAPEKPSMTLRAARFVGAGMLFGAGFAGVVTLAVVPRLIELRPIDRPLPVARARAAEIDVAALQSDPTPQPAYVPGPSYAPTPPITRDDLDHQIRWIAPQAWEIDRSLIERAIESSTSLRTNRVIPHERDGRVVGVKIYGIRRDSLLGRLGLQSGDMLISVNGFAMTQPESAFDAYQHLRYGDALFVRLERRGEERVHVYRITP